MSTTGSPQPAELTPQESAAILQRILAAVEKDERARWVQITCAVVLSLATMSSAWCAYQAALWGGVQTFRLAAAQKAGRDSASAENDRNANSGVRCLHGYELDAGEI